MAYPLGQESVVMGQGETDGEALQDVFSAIRFRTEKDEAVFKSLVALVQPSSSWPGSRSTHHGRGS